MREAARSLGAISLALGALLAAAPSARACACCTHTGWRYVAVEPLSPERRAQLDQMRFAEDARLVVGEADAHIEGVDNPDTRYRLAVARQDDRLIFRLRDRRGRSGSFVLAIPHTISIFEVDPRGPEQDNGLGPSLYKEWIVSAPAAADGLFSGALRSGARLTLIFHGRGIGCTDAGHFTHWTLQLANPDETLTWIGAIESAGR